MSFPATSSSLLLFVTLVLVVVPAFVGAKLKLQLTSDEPVIMGSNITFTLRMQNPEMDMYDVDWIELIHPMYRRKKDTLSKENNYTCTWTLNYLAENPNKTSPSAEEPYAYPGIYSVSAAVSYTILFFVKNVGTAVGYFNVDQDFPIDLHPEQPGVPLHKKYPNYITTANETTLVAEVHDPYNYLEGGSNVTWSWYNSTHFVTNTTTRYLKQNITKEGNFYYNVTVSGNFPSKQNPNRTILREGFMETNVTARDPIKNFTVVGEKWFPQGRLLNLNFQCSGSQPFTYCAQMHSGPYNLTGNETCVSPEVTTTCEIPYMWYLRDPGLYSLVVIMENDVSNITNRTLINVYKVSKQQPLSIIIVPLTCTLLALVMIIFGIAYFWESRARYTVEVADFDFGQHEEYPYMTFAERLKTALTASTSSRQRLYNSTDDDAWTGGSRRASHFS